MEASASSAGGRECLQQLATAFARKVEVDKMPIGQSSVRMEMARLNEAFISKDGLQEFASNTLYLSEREFDVRQLSDSDLEQLKGMVIGELGKARANEHGWTNDPKSTFAWLRDKFMTFFMFLSASFHSETMFHENAETTQKVKRLLREGMVVAGSGGAIPAVAAEEAEGFEIVGPPASGEAGSESAEGAAGEEPGTAPSAEGSPSGGGGASGAISLSAALVNNLRVVDTPRDGSCMLWSLATFGNESNLGEDNSARIKIRDVIIPQYRQVISIGLRMEAVNLRAASAGNSEAATRIEKLKEADALEFRAQDVELSGGVNPVTWCGAIAIEPKDMRFVAPIIGKDIAIISTQGGQSIYYLLTKEGKCVTAQDLGGMDRDAFRTQFESALRHGPAIFAEDGHARAIQYDHSLPAAPDPHVDETDAIDMDAECAVVR